MAVQVKSTPDTIQPEAGATGCKMDSKMGSAMGSAKPKSNTRQALTTLRQLILDNRLAPGSNHLESELATMLGMSRTPVREATLILEAQGLVEVKPRHGVRILPISPTDMEEIYDILTELESLAAERAALAGYTDEELETAKKAIEEMEKALAKDDLEAWANADARFHTELVRLGNNKRVCHIFKTYSDQVSRARKLTLHLRPKPTRSNEDHRKVFKAIREGDEKKARTLHRNHRIQSKKVLLKLINQYGFHSV